MRFNKNAQVTFDNGATKIKLWNASFSISGGNSVFTLIIDILQYCKENRSMSDLLSHYEKIPEKVLSQIIQFLVLKNVLSEDYVSEELKEQLGENVVCYIERNYKKCNEIGQNLVKTEVDIYCQQEVFNELRNSLELISIHKVNWKTTDCMEQSKSSTIAIIDCKFESIEACRESLEKLTECYERIYACVGINGFVVGLSASNKTELGNILSYYVDTLLVNDNSKMARKIVYLLFGKLIIDGYLCNSDNMNLFTVSDNLMVKRYIIPTEDVREYVEAEKLGNEPEAIEEQAAVNSLYSMVKNKKVIIEDLGYGTYQQMPVITIEAKLRDLVTGEEKKYLSSAQQFTTASLKTVTRALSGYLTQQEATENSLVVAEYTPANYQKRIQSLKMKYILEKYDTMHSYDVDAYVKERLATYQSLINFEDIRFCCCGNAEYDVYQMYLCNEKMDYCEGVLGSDINELAESLLLDYIGVCLNHIMMHGKKADYTKELAELETCSHEEWNSKTSEEINKNRELLLAQYPCQVKEEEWSYQKYFKESNLLISKIHFIEDRRK